MPPQNRSHVPIGATLEGKYRVTREIGRGGMAAVYEAENIDIGKRVAVKVLAAELITSRIVRERFIREARAAAAIRSPYICDVYDSGMFEERPFLVMELLEGESLYDMMTRVRRLNVKTTLKIATQTCRGLGKAHEANVIHRDMKPENIFLTKNEDGEMVAKLLDFGLAKFYEPTGGTAAQARLTREGALFGTPAYMSPEQAKGQGEVDQRADLWALGCIVYECLTGRTVWNVDQGVAMILAQIAGAPLPRPSRFRKDLPAGFDSWFFKALDRDAAKRFQTAKEFADALEEALAPREPSSATVAAPEPTPPPDLANLQQHPDDGEPPPSGRGSPQAPVETRATEFDRGGPGKAIAALLTVAIITLGGYGFWLYVLNPPGSSLGSAEAELPSVPPSTAPDPPKLSPLERDPYARQIGVAQEALAKGNRKEALKAFREAFNDGGTGVARALLSQAAVGVKKSGSCRMTGLGRPRPFDLLGPTSRPTLAITSAGPVAVWADNHLEVSKRQTFSVLLDSSLRRVTMTHGVTPEANFARVPQLLPAGDRLALVYGDRGGSDPGVYVRLLERDGRIAGKAIRVSEKIAGLNPDPSLTQAPDGTYWVVWEANQKNGVRDIMARQLSADLEPIAPAVRLTALYPTRGLPTVGDTPDVAVTETMLLVTFSLERIRQHQVLLLTIPLNEPKLKTGGVSAPEAQHTQDVHLGQMEQLSSTGGKHTQPRIDCSTHGCFAVWDNEKAGALAAYIEPDKAEKIWHREFAVRGARPGLSSTEKEVLVAWYEGGRVKVASLTRDGLGTASVIARVNGYQPYPELAPGPEPGEWYIAWRDYEAGHLETFVARAKCK
jgi:serine/threonine protein kinase